MTSSRKSVEESVKTARMETKTRTVLVRLMGDRARSPAGSVSVVHDDHKGGALRYSAFATASFLAPY